MTKIIKFALFLAIICGIAGGALAYVNAITYPIIQERKLAADKATLEQIFSNGEFQLVENVKDETKLIEKLFEVKDQGYIYKLNVQGYKDIISMMVGFNQNGEIVKLVVLSVNDTPDIGTKVKDEEYTEKFTNKQLTDSLDTISGATISSSAVVKAVDAARAHFSANYK
jgi:Na+-translocating ferredoxin:NAD+ oxidoreductase subunit G